MVWPNTVEFRLYQTRIADVASEKNTLVILPTALGKTVISAIVAGSILYDYRESKVLVMAPTRPLVMQHRNSFLKMLKLREKDTVLLTGKTPPSHRRLIWEGEARVVFSTPQVVRNDLLAGRLSLENYGLVVFDECHRAVKRYAYTDIAQSYVSQARYPLILGMTASPGSDLNRILEVCRNLYIEGVEYRSEHDPDVKPYIHPIEVEWKRVNLPNAYLRMKLQIGAMLDKRLNWLYNKRIIRTYPRYVTKTTLIKAGDELRFILQESIEEERGQIFTAIINQSLGLTLFHMLELLETQGLHTLKMFLAKVELEQKRSYAILVSDPHYRKLKALVEGLPIEHPKAELLMRIVSNQFHSNNSSRMLVFTQYRDTASHLVEQLNSVPSVRADRFVGQASKTLDKGLSQEEQAEKIEMLKEGELNVLVATSIAEEGLDIPAVDHVIFYEPIPSGIRYIQRRGRTGRKTAGKVTILAANNTLDMIYLYASGKRTDRMRRNAENVNSKLPPIIRKRHRPPPNPLTMMEIRRIEEEARQIKDEPKIVKSEAEALKEFDRRVGHISRKLYLKLLERGASGIDLSQIMSEKKFGDVPFPVLKGSIGKMMKEGLVTEIESDRYAVTSSVKSVDKKAYEIAVEKIYPGSAVVRVNDKWRARMAPEEYNGPASLIKKDSRFKATADLYRMNGRLCVRVMEVTQRLN